MNRSCYGINKVLDEKPLVPLFTRSMPIVQPILKVRFSDDSAMA